METKRWKEIEKISPSQILSFKYITRLMCTVYNFVGQLSTCLQTTADLYVLRKGVISNKYFILHSYVAEPPFDKQLTCELIRWARWTGFVINAKNVALGTLARQFLHFFFLCAMVAVLYAKAMVSGIIVALYRI